ncbi:acyltransferase family protein [Novosphingobium sp. KCTC 2891]|uniref:acyltransferase family protein n=1 Tax=Novosphingobium sp. KCTC 2891 TaxID=2989730 RepID=UPI002222DBCD|nr:acyltransferase [Novosphingobium sp. KCTC 2891]
MQQAHSADRPASGRKLYNVQALRALAAWAVVGHHLVDALHNYIAKDRGLPNPSIGSFGVEIFFVISGYVMMLTASRRRLAPGKFFVERLVRISPPYWLLTIAAFGAIYSGLNMFGHKQATFDRLFASLLYMPYFNGAQLERPVVFPGWTLNYEMMFYALFALCLFIRSERWRMAAMIGAITLAVLAQFFSTSPLADYLGRDIIVGFAFGILLWPLSNRLVISRAVAAIAMSAGFALLIVCDATWLRDATHAELVVSFGALLIVAGALFLEKSGHALRSGWVIFQGDASYALYLIHPFALQAVGKASLLAGINQSVPGLILTLVMMVVAAALAAAAMHILFERPVHRMARKLL